MASSRKREYETTTTLGMVSFFYQLVSCFVLINFCSCYKVKDYVSSVNARSSSSSAASNSHDRKGVTRLWTIKLKNLKQLSTDDVKKKTKLIARELKLENLGQVGNLPGHYTFASPNFTYAEIARTLRAHDDIAKFERQNLMNIKTYMKTHSDPDFLNQWHLFNQEYYTNSNYSIERKLLDSNLVHVWDHDVVGKGVVVAVVDEGVEWKHKDLKANYFGAGSYDYIDDDEDPTPDAYNIHGTQAAGVIAASDNSLCGVGVAYRSRFSGIDILSGSTTNAKTAEALNYKMDENHIYSNSWGPDNDGKTAENLDWLIEEAFNRGSKEGRDTYGSIFVFAAGNGGDEFDNCNYNGYASSKHVIPITSVTEYGVTPTYAERCNSIMASTLSGPHLESKNEDNKLSTLIGRYIITTENMNNCASNYSGTSASASIASGIIALMLQVRPCLYWRDVHHIIAMTASDVTLSKKVELFNSSDSFEKNTPSVFYENEAGYTYNDHHGFGFLDAWKIANAARVWKPVPKEYSFQPKCHNRTDHKIPLDKKLDLSCSSVNISTGQVETIENVVVTLNLKHEYRGMLKFFITCPSGTESVIHPRPLDTSSHGLKNFVFRTVKCWGESAKGEYRFKIEDTRKVGNKSLNQGMLRGWQITVYGSAMTPRDLRERWNVVRKSFSDGGSRLDLKFRNSPSNCPSGMNPIVIAIIVLLSVIGVCALLWMLYFYITHHNKSKQQVHSAPNVAESASLKTLETVESQRTLDNGLYDLE